MTCADCGQPTSATYRLCWPCRVNRTRATAAGQGLPEHVEPANATNLLTLLAPTIAAPAPAHLRIGTRPDEGSPAGRGDWDGRSRDGDTNHAGGARRPTRRRRASATDRPTLEKADGPHATTQGPS